MTRNLQRLIITDSLFRIDTDADKEEEKVSAKYELSKLGSLSYGGTVFHNENGDTIHEDSGYAQYFIPEKARNYPMIFWHGLGQSGVCFERTVDSQEGFMQDFLSDNWPCYIVDQPRRGRAARTRSLPKELMSPSAACESGVWTGFRLGTWFPPESPKAFSNLAFPMTPLAIDQFMRQQCPDGGEEPRTNEYLEELGANMGELIKQAGPSILFTHSMSGKYGWFTAMYGGDNLKAIISYEPGCQFAWPDGQFPDVDSPVLDIIDTYMGMLSVPMEDFLKLTKIPIRILYGDNITKVPIADYGQDKWRVAVERGRKFVELINSYGGDAQLIQLPEIGITGNSHSGFQETNHAQIADYVKAQLHELGLDGDDQPNCGPVPKEVPEFTIPYRD